MGEERSALDGGDEGGRGRRGGGGGGWGRGSFSYNFNDLLDKHDFSFGNCGNGFQNNLLDHIQRCFWSGRGGFFGSLLYRCGFFRSFFNRSFFNRSFFYRSFFYKSIFYGGFFYRGGFFL